MHRADGTHTHEHARDRDVSSASAANDLTSLTASATPENPTVHSRAASGVPGASDASLCVEAGSASTTTPTTFASAHARAEDAGTTETACKRCANPGNKRPHTCNLKRAQPAFGSRELSSRRRMLSGPPEPRAEPTPPRVQPLVVAEAATLPQASMTAGHIDDDSGSQGGEDEIMSVADEGLDREIEVRALHRCCPSQKHLNYCACVDACGCDCLGRGRVRAADGARDADWCVRAPARRRVLRRSCAERGRPSERARRAGFGSSWWRTRDRTGAHASGCSATPRAV